MGTNGHIDLKPWIQMIAKHFLDLAFGAQGGRGVVSQYHRHQLPVTRSALGLGRNQDVIANACVMREQKANATLFHIAPDHFDMRSVQHFNDLPLGPATAIETGDRCQYLIAIKHLIHLAGGEKQILCLPLERSRKTVTISVAHHPTAQQVHSLGHTISTAPAGNNLPVALHRPQAFTQCVEIALATQTQLFGNASKSHGGIRRLEQAQNHFPTGNGVLIPALLSRRMGVNGWSRGTVFTAWRQDEVRWLETAGWKEGPIIRGKQPADCGAAMLKANRYAKLTV